LDPGNSKDFTAESVYVLMDIRFSDNRERRTNCVEKFFPDLSLFSHTESARITGKDHLNEADGEK
jgi:hypothetical protein